MTTRTSSLQRLFQPRSIAVIGASRHPEKLGAVVFHNILAAGFRGALYPVNANGGRIAGRRVFTTVSALPRTVDLAVIVTPAPTVPDLVRACGEKGIGNVVVLSAGFGEMGHEGKEREDRIRAFTQQHGMNLLGPNCLGFAHGDFRLNASFGDALAPGGTVTLLSQSGAMAVALVDWVKKQGIGIRASVSMGNKAGLTEIELLRHFGRDPKTRMLVLYLENMERGEEFVRLAQRIVRAKPVIVLKAGESPIAAKAVRFHTGALAGDNAVMRAALTSAGVHQAHSLRDLDRLVVALQSATVPRGRRVAIVTNAGGPGVLATDALAQSKLQRTLFTSQSRKRLANVLPAAASLANPIDIIGDAGPDRFVRALDIVLRDNHVDGIVVLLTPQIMTRPTDVARRIARLAKRTRTKAITAAFVGGTHVAEAREVLRRAGIANFGVPEDAVRAMEDLWLLFRARALHAVHHPSATVTLSSANCSRLAREGLLLADEANAVLDDIGLRSVPGRFVESAKHVPAAARSLGFPVALKWISPKLLHKTDRGAVVVDIRSAQELESAVRRLQRSLPIRRGSEREGWLVQRYVRGPEVFLGAKRDPSFGPVIVVGAGGTDTELLNIAVTCLAPFTKTSLLETLSENKQLIAWLTKRRGKTPVDLSVLATAAANLGRLMEAVPTLAEVDINPLLFLDGVRPVVVDARIRVHVVP